MSEALDPRFDRARLRLLLAVMFCYLFYYTGRQAFGFAMPGFQEELGLTKAQLGWCSAARAPLGVHSVASLSAPFQHRCSEFILSRQPDQFCKMRMMS